MNIDVLLLAADFTNVPEDGAYADLQNTHLNEMSAFNVRGRITNMRKLKFANFVDVYIGTG